MRVTKKKKPCAEHCPFKSMANGMSCPKAKAKVRKVMREFKAKTLKSSSGQLVTNRRQGLAIALSEARRLMTGRYK